MEVSSNQNQKDTLEMTSRRKGGFLTMPFIIANECFEKIASYGLMPNMIFYVMGSYNLTLAHGSSLLQLWGSLSNFTPVLGAFLSDSYFGKFQVIAMGSISSLLGVLVLWLTAMIPQAKPSKGETADSGQLALLCASFILMSLGAGGIRPCSIVFGADQLTNKDDPKNERIIQSYFGFYYASMGISTMIALTIMVYIQDKYGWKLGFGVPAILMLLCVLTFYFGYPLYVKLKPTRSVFTDLVQVIVVSFKNRSLAYPVDGKYHFSNESNLSTPSKHLRFLNKACIIKDPENDINPDGSTTDPWKLCTVTQVEALKSIIRVLPIWSTGIILFMNLGSSMTTLQANSMDRHLTSNFQVPAGTFSVFIVIALTIWLVSYDRIMVPLLARFTSQKRGFSNIVRMGMGQVLCVLSTIVSAAVEIIRRRIAIQEGLDKKPGVVGMSAFWLAPQLCLLGLADGLYAVGQIEFYYSQLPKNMASVAMALSSLNSGFAGLLGSFVVNTVEKITKEGGKKSWVDSNPNQAHYDHYYWFLTILCSANFFYFLFCCWAYGPSEEVKTRVSDDKELVKLDES